MRHITYGLMVLCAAALLAGCQTTPGHHHADRGALLGGLAGAGVGAAIGKNNGNTAAGALVGSAVGALAGNAVGEGIDAEVARNNAIIAEQMGRRLSGAVTMADVVAMSQAGLSDEVIITHVRANGVGFEPQVNDLIAMKNQGVSERVMAALENPPPPIKTAPPAPAPVVVEEHYYGPPPYWRRHHWHHHHRHHGPRVSWGVTFGGH